MSSDVRFDAAIDWGDYRKGKLVGYDPRTGASTAIKMPLDEVLPLLAARGAKNIAIEASFGSFDLREKAKVLAVAEKCGVALYITPTKQTGRYRQLHGLQDEKSDELDAKCIYEIAQTNRCFAKAKYPSEQQLARQAERRSTAQGRALVLRSLGWPEEECQEFTQYLPEEVPDWVKKTKLWEPSPTKKNPNRGYLTTWCLPMVAAALQVIEEGGGREDYGRKIGAYAFGFPSLLRSNFYYGMVAPATKGALGVKSRAGQDALPPSEVKVARKVQMQVHRRAVRWLFHKVREAAASLKCDSSTGTSDPATGTSHS